MRCTHIGTPRHDSPLQMYVPKTTQQVSVKRALNDETKQNGRSRFRSCFTKTYGITSNL